MKQRATYLFIAAATAAVFFVGLSGRAQTAATSSWIIPQRLAEQLDSDEVAVLDVRTASEFSAGHIPGALNVSHEHVSSQASRIREHAAGRPLVLYCRSGRRASIAEQDLAGQGIGPVMHLEGQMNGWAAAGLPVARSN